MVGSQKQAAQQARHRLEKVGGVRILPEEHDSVLASLLEPRGQPNAVAMENGCQPKNRKQVTTAAEMEMNTDRNEKEVEDMAAEKEEEGKKEDVEEWSMDTLLGFGKFHHFQIWVVQTFVAILGAFGLFQVIYLVHDPPDWSCENGEEKCSESGVVCNGSVVVYNVTHQNFLHSLPVEYNWLCQQASRSSDIIMAQGLGMILNSLIFGPLCDKVGRMTVMHITNITFLIFRLICLHVTQSFPAFLTCIILSTGFFPVGCRAGYTLMAEFCNEAGRKYAFISGWVWWVFGMTVIPFIAEGLKHWYSFGLVTTLCSLVLVAAIPLVPESPRWLISQGKFDRAASTIATIRRLNGDASVENLEAVLRRISPQEDKDKDMLGIKSMLNHKSLFKLSVCMSVIFSVNDYFYIGSQLNAVNLAGSVFLNFALLALTEMPSVFVGQFIIDRLGRRWCHFACMFLTTVCFIVDIILLSVWDSMETLVLTFAILAKTISNIGWFVMWVQAIEVFPTELRNSGINVAAVVSMVVGMSAPYTIDLGGEDKRYPYIVFASLGVLGMASTSLLPETKGSPLNQGLGDVDAMYQRMKFCQLRPWLHQEKDVEKANVQEKNATN